MASQKPDEGEKAVAGDFAIVRIRGDDVNLHPVWTLLTELRPQLLFEAFEHLLGDSHGSPVHYEAAMIERNCVALIGWRVHTDTRIGKHVYVADLVVAAGHRGRGLGRAMISHVVDRARQLGCTSMVLDSGNNNLIAHRFYDIIGFQRTAVHFEIGIDV